MFEKLKDVKKQVEELKRIGGWGGRGEGAGCECVKKCENGCSAKKLELGKKIHFFSL